jgi:hypothetical protein
MGARERATSIRRFVTTMVHLLLRRTALSFKLRNELATEEQFRLAAKCGKGLLIVRSTGYE